MNYSSRNVKAAPAISLAEEEDFSLGPLRLLPSARQICLGDRSETVEPRVMQVLVVLARAEGQVVSREQLIDRCWGGRIVGDDAVNNAIVKVRALSGLSEEPSFEIETIPRVGYRLRRFRPERANPAADPGALPAAPLRRWSWRRTALAAAIVITSCAVAGLYSYLHREPEWIVADSQQPFIGTPSMEDDPALAPDGTMIAYSAGPGINNRHIYLRLLNGGDPIRLTQDAYDAGAPAWSPDSRMIAYVIFQAGHPCRIMEIPVPAGQPHQIGQCRISERSNLAFDPSGHVLFFSDAPVRGTADRILKLDLDNGHVSAVTHPGGNAVADGSPSVSPDGGALLYDRDLGEQGSQIRLMSLSGGADRLVAAFDSGDANATFSTDGSSIFLSRSHDADNSLWAYPVQGGEPWRIISSGEHLGRLSAGPNGLLAIELAYPGGQLVAVTPHSDQPPRPINSGGLRTWCVDYAPDGTFLATGWHSATFGIWISGANGPLRELLRPEGLACAIRWSPDGTRFAFVEWRGHGIEVPVMTRGGEPIARLRYPGFGSGLLDWTADGKSILTSQQEKLGWRIWRTDLATPDKSAPITPYGWLSPRVHGTMLFAEKDGVPGIWRIDGVPRRVTDGPVPEASDVYTVAGDRLIYSDTTDPDHPTFSAQNINGGPKERLAPLPNGQVDFVFGIEPKSGAIVYTQGLDDIDIGLLRLVRR
ncbi:MAG TPA: winged helix-turn-helix domain-containing protein [Rhizomicrobium sp.]|nr:winged helix-turn-helix domain-containing protein [Rhizomicrobium sp.]